MKRKSQFLLHWSALKRVIKLKYDTAYCLTVSGRFLTNWMYMILHWPLTSVRHFFTLTPGVEIKYWNGIIFDFVWSSDLVLAKYILVPRKFKIAGVENVDFRKNNLINFANFKTPTTTQSIYDQRIAGIHQRQFIAKHLIKMCAKIGV